MTVKVSVAIHPGEHIAEELAERSMRHPLSTSDLGGLRQGSLESSACPVSVGDMDGFVVVDVVGEAVPQHFQPAVAEALRALWWLLPAVIFVS